MSGFTTNNCFNLVVYRTCVGFAGRPMRVLAHQAPLAITYTVRDRPSVVSHYTRPRIVCMTARFDVTLKIAEQNRIVRTGKYESEVINNVEKNCARGILLLKRSSGPLATAELYLFSSPLRRRFSVTSAYNSILFCYLQRNVEPCCHAHDSRSCIV